MKCKICGAENLQDSRFCSNCGYKFNTETEYDVKYYNDVDVNVINKSNIKKKKEFLTSRDKLWGAIIGIALLIWAGWYFSTNEIKMEETKDTFYKYANSIDSRRGKDEERLNKLKTIDYHELADIAFDRITSSVYPGHYSTAIESATAFISATSGNEYTMTFRAIILICKEILEHEEIVTNIKNEYEQYFPMEALVEFFEADGNNGRYSFIIGDYLETTKDGYHEYTVASFNLVEVEYYVLRLKEHPSTNMAEYIVMPTTETMELTDGNRNIQAHVLMEVDDVYVNTFYMDYEGYVWRSEEVRVLKQQILDISGSFN